MQYLKKLPLGLIGNVLKVAAGVGVTGGIIYESLYTVEGGHKGVMYNRIYGVSDQVIGEGTHIKIPWIQRPVFYDIRTRAYRRQSLTGTKDLQMVNITVRALLRPVKEQLPTIYQKLGEDYDERVLPSLVNEVVKQVVAQFTAAQLLTMREQVSTLIRQNLQERSQEFYMYLEDVSITDLTFGHEFMKAVEMKQVAQQEAKKAAFLVQQAEQEKKSAIIKAEADARSAQLIGEMVQGNPAFLEIRRLEAAQEIAQVMAASNNRVFLESDSLLVNLLSESGAATRLDVAGDAEDESQQRYQPVPAASTK